MSHLRLFTALLPALILGACGGDRSTAGGDAGVSTAALSAREVRRALWSDGVVQPVAATRLVSGVIAKAPGAEPQFVLRRPDSVVHFDRRGVAVSLSDGKHGWSVRATLRAGTPVAPLGARAGRAKVNRYVGESSQWERDVPTYEQIAWEDAAPGIDWLVEPSRGGFSYQYVLSPGAELRDLDTEWAGASELRAVDDGRGVEVVTGIGTVRVSGLRAFAIENGRRIELPARHVVSGNVVRIVVDGWSGKVPLVIDPSVAFSTFLGGASSEFANATAVDASGNVYVSGSARSADFPTTGGFDTTYGGAFSDAFVTKLSPTGTLMWSTYLGGTNDESASGVAIDPTGNVVVVGSTRSTDFPASGGFDTTLGGGGFEDGFVTKISASGTLVWSSYLGGASNDNVSAVSTDAAGDVFLTGSTMSSDFPATGGFDTTLGALGSDAFVTKVSAAGSLLWSSYLGGARGDSSHGVATDATGNVVVVGSTSSTDFPTTSGLDTTESGFSDVFVTKVSGAGVVLWSTYLGGSSEENFPSVALSTAGDVHVAGITYSDDFPTTGGFDTTRNGGDGFVTKLSSTGTVTWSSFLGGTGIEDRNAVAVDSSGSVFLAGNTYANDFPTTGAFDTTPDTTYGDAFLTKISPSGALVWSSYLGGSHQDQANDIAVFGDAVIVVGFTQSSDFPLLSPYDSTMAGGDAFIFQKVQSATGAACTHLTDCASAFCADGFCCNEACTGTCRACSAAKSGGANGTCGPIADGTNPDTECAAAVCSGPGVVNKAQVCNGSGACRADGTTSCGLFACAGGACLTTCTTAADCVAGNYCAAGVCTAKKTTGAACVTTVECASGFCTDGFCCDTACGGACEACSAAKKGSGADGTCGNVAADSDPKSMCAADVGFPTSCGADGACDGAGACRVYAKPGTACGTTACSSASVTGPSCNGAGTCDSTPRSCGAYTCDAAGVACRTSCTADAECTATSYCTSLGTCAPKKSSGTCVAPNECTNFCVDGVCCATACTGQCEACNVAGTEGTCTAVTGAPRFSRAACAGDPAVCGGTCDGTNRASCAYEPSTKSCGSVCASGQQTASTCDAKGACAAGPSVSCAPYTCDAEGKACRAKCAANTDCTTGYECVSDACVPARTTGTCSLDGRTSTSVDGMVTACGAYRCDPSTGACRQLCAASADCAEGNLCDVATKVCTTPSASEEDGGCGCSTPGRTDARPLALLALLTLVALRRRRG